MGILLVLLLISVPIFYLYGILRFIDEIRNGNKTNSAKNKQSTGNQGSVTVIRSLVDAVKKDPEVTVKTFLKTYKQSDIPPVSKAQPEPDTSSNLITNIPVPKPSTISSEPTTDKNDNPLFQPISLQNWYQQNTIQLMLYVGAFFIVAAVVLFISFQWQSLNDPLKFIYVLAFTFAWFVTSYALRQYPKLKEAAVTFATIGALLIPLNGIAYQEFMAPDPHAGLGITWLITSIISVSIYLLLSHIYKKRYFTYFSTLSSLSTSLAVVHISQAPAEYYVIASIITAIVLLATRIYFAKIHSLDQRYGTDVELSATISLIVSIFAGLILLESQGIDFFSFQVSLVTILATIYSWLLYSFKKDPIILGISHVATLLATAHLIKSFDPPIFVFLFGTAMVNFSLQLFFNWYFRTKDKEFQTTKYISLGSTGVLWFLSLILDYHSTNSIIFSLLYAIHAAIAAEDLDQPILHTITAFLIPIFFWDLLSFLQVSTDIIPLAIGIVSSLILFASHSKIMVKYHDYYRIPAITTLLLASFYATTQLASPFTLSVAPVTLSLQLTSLLGPAVLALESFFLPKNQSNKATTETTIVSLVLTGLIITSATLDRGSTITLLNTLLVIIYSFSNALSLRNAYFLGFGLFGSMVLSDTLIELGKLPESILPLLLSLTPLLVFVTPTLMKLQDEKQGKICRGLALGFQIFIAFVAFGLSQSLSIVNVYDLTALISGFIGLGMVWKYLEYYPEEKAHYVKAFSSLALYYWIVILLHGYFTETDIFNNIQAFSLPLGSVLFGLGFADKRKSKTDVSELATIDIAACLFLFLPTLVQSLDTTGTFYSFLGMIYGLILFVWGNTAASRKYQQIGIAAVVLFVLIETGEVLFSLPRWLIIGILGFVLIAGAIYLLSKKPSKK